MYRRQFSTTKKHDPLCYDASERDTTNEMERVRRDEWKRDQRIAIRGTHTKERRKKKLMRKKTFYSAFISTTRLAAHGNGDSV